MKFVSGRQMKLNDHDLITAHALLETLKAQTYSGGTYVEQKPQMSTRTQSRHPQGLCTQSTTFY